MALVPVDYVFLMSVPSCYLLNGEFPLHVVYIFWDTMSKRVKWFALMLVVRLYRDIRDWFFIIVTGRYGHEIWLGVEPFLFRDVIYVRVSHGVMKLTYPFYYCDI